MFVLTRRPNEAFSLQVPGHRVVVTLRIRDGAAFLIVAGHPGLEVECPFPKGTFLTIRIGAWRVALNHPAGTAGTMRIGIDAPPQVSVVREELVAA